MPLTKRNRSPSRSKPLQREVAADEHPLHARLAQAEPDGDLRVGDPLSPEQALQRIDENGRMHRRSPPWTESLRGRLPTGLPSRLPSVIETLPRDASVNGDCRFRSGAAAGCQFARDTVSSDKDLIIKMVNGGKSIVDPADAPMTASDSAAERTIEWGTVSRERG
jgi:hypothetical protein